MREQSNLNFICYFVSIHSLDAYGYELIQDVVEREFAIIYFHLYTVTRIMAAVVKEFDTCCISCTAEETQ